MKKIRKFALIFVFSQLLSSVFAVTRGGQDLILCGHWVYSALLSLEMEMGRVTFSDQAPISINELKTYLEDIDYERLSEPGKKQYDRIIEYIEEQQ